MLSLTTDYRTSMGNPEPYLRRIAEAGFSHIHWCHQWNTDFLYSRWEIAAIRRWLKAYGLSLLDLHGSSGPEKNWASPLEHERQAGVELVKNRIDMTARLGGDAVVMHIPRVGAQLPSQWLQLLRSLDHLEPYARARDVRLAIENMPDDDFSLIRDLLSRYDPRFLGICYDSGHGNLGTDGLAHLDTVKDRLICVHLHDNGGPDRGDQHLIPKDGTVDWPRLADILAASAYSKCISMESNMQSYPDGDETEFLRLAFERGSKIAEMVLARSGVQPTV